MCCVDSRWLHLVDTRKFFCSRPASPRRSLAMKSKRRGARADPTAKRRRAGDSQPLEADAGAVSEPPLAVANHPQRLIRSTAPRATRSSWSSRHSGAGSRASAEPTVDRFLRVFVGLVFCYVVLVCIMLCVGLYYL